MEEPTVKRSELADLQAKRGAKLTLLRDSTGAEFAAVMLDVNDREAHFEILGRIVD